MGIDGDALVDFTRRLVRIPSVYDPGRGLDEEPAADLVIEQMRSFGWEPEIDVVAPGRPNVVATIDGGSPGPTLMFEGHLDVVTEGSLDQWTHDPFGAELIDGRIWGRGAADMKAGVAAMLFAADELCRRGGFPGRLVLGALVDEEGMMIGAKDFVARGRTDGIDAAICCEPEGGEICHVAKGALRLRLDFTGKMAHGAMPFQGRNPNRAVGAVLEALAELETELQAHHAEHPHLGRVWVTPTVLRAGEPVQMNVMPKDASIWIDVRTIPAVDHDDLVSEVRRRVADHAGRTGVTAAVEVLDVRPAVEVAEDDALVQALWAAHEAVAASPPRLGGVPGATDGTVLTSRGGVPTVVYGPGGKWIAHQADEFVEVADVLTHADVYVEAAHRFLTVGRAVTAGRHNALTDVAGVKVGQFQRRGRGWLTGTTVVLPPAGTVGGVDVRGGGPGTRETDLLDPVNLVQRVDAVCLTGGSAYGLAAVTGVVDWLAERNLGLPIGSQPHHVVPIVPAAVLFDLGLGGRFEARPDAAFGYRAADAARGGTVHQGTIGAGTGAHAGGLKGGMGTASIVLDSGITVAALVAANPGGSPVDPRTGELWGARYGLPGEFDHLSRPHRAETRSYVEDPPVRPPLNTTLAIVATDAALDKSECSRMAMTAHDGMARAVSPIHLYTDGDVAFALATGARALPEVRSDGGHIRPTETRPGQLGLLLAAAADCVTRAIVHAVLAASSAGGLPSYLSRFPSALRR